MSNSAKKPLLAIPNRLYPLSKTFNGRRVGSIRLKKRLAPATRRIVLEGLQGEQSVAEICRREGLNTNIYYRWIGLPKQ